MRKELKVKINEDIFRYFNNGKKPLFFRWRVRSIKYTTVLRKVQYYRENNLFLYLINELHLRILMSRYLIQIPSKTKIGRGIYIGHLGSVIINEDTVMGDNINLATGVTIGQTNRGKKKGSPIIGNEVWIGTNAVIVGKVRIGNNVLIAPNTYVNIDIPSDSIVIGNPAKIIPNKNATKEYVHNLV